MDYRHLLVTGGAGFIGANFVRHVLGTTEDVRVTNLDALTYSGNPENLADLADDPRYRFVHGDIRDRELVAELLAPGPEPVDAVLNFAAESHVDRALLDPLSFVDNNVVGTGVLLEASRRAVEKDGRNFRFLQVSTDEVYGSLDFDDPAFREDTLLEPNSVYSASKSASEHIVRAYHRTFGLPVVTTRCSNNYGPYQYPEKLIPLMITRALKDKPLPVYGDGRNIRDWLHVDDHCRAIVRVLEDGQPGTIYNVGGEAETANIDLVKKILAALGKPESLIEYVTDRPGHDRRYAVEIDRINTELGWSPGVDLDTGLAQTVRWYVDNEGWWSRLIEESETALRKVYRA